MLNLQYLKQKRQDAHYTQNYMANKLGYKSRVEYYQFETGRRKLYLDQFIKIAKILDLDLAAAIIEVSKEVQQ